MGLKHYQLVGVFMLRYEELLLTTPEITGDEAKKCEDVFDKSIQAQKGSIISFECWGKYKLSYPVKKNDYGIYFLVRFEIPQGTSVIQDIKAIFVLKLNTVVMRNIFTRLDENQSLAYQRPKSLEEAPSRDVESFLKENKMSGLISSVESSERPSGKEKAAEASPKSVQPQEEIMQEKEQGSEDK